MSLDDIRNKLRQVKLIGFYGNMEEIPAFLPWLLLTFGVRFSDRGPANSANDKIKPLNPVYNIHFPLCMVAGTADIHGALFTNMVKL